MESGATGREREVVVIGAGIVGVCAALYIQNEGFSVTLVDRVRPGDPRSCSFGNAGVLSVASCVPDSLPDTLRQVPAWLISAKGPLGIRWPYLPRLLPYLWRFGRAAQADRIAPTADALSALHAPALELYKALAAEAGTPELIRESAYIHVFDDSRPFDENALPWRLRRERGARLSFISGDELREIEPALSPRYRKAVLMEGHGHATDPAQLVASLAGLLERRGGRILKAEVSGIVPRSGRSVVVETASALLTAGHVVVAAGVILFDPIFQGLAIALMAGEVASLLLSRATVPVVYYMMKRKQRTASTSEGNA